MGLVQGKYVTVDDILTTGHQHIILIEGDPGAGKTTVVTNICKRWAEGELLTQELVFFILLRDIYYHQVTSSNDLFDKLRCPEMKEHAQQNNGKGLVFILDGWDELPDHLQSQSFFYDVIFKKGALTCSTIIVTSRPSCSDHIAEAVEDHYYQILGFSREKVGNYITEYFKDDLNSATDLLDIIHTHDYLQEDFYIPITAVIMCFVYHKSGKQFPKTLSKLYEKFVLLCILRNIPEKDRNFTHLLDIPNELKLLFSKLCNIAFSMLTDNRLMFNKEELNFENFHFVSVDGFGLLSIEHITNELGNEERHYSFIHRAVQELLAAISIVKSNSVGNTFDEHFNEGSYLINVFPFVFGLMPKEHRTFLGEKMRQKFINSSKSISSRTLTTMLYCLFEAQDHTLCHEFGKVFNENRNSIDLSGLKSNLEYHYAAYFLSACGCKGIELYGLELTHTRIEIIAQYLCDSLANNNINHEMISSFSCDCDVDLPNEGIELLAQVLAREHSLVSLRIVGLSQDHTKIMCNSICKHNHDIVELTMQRVELNKEDLDSLRNLVMTLKHFHMLTLEGFFAEGASSNFFCDALCNTTSLEKLFLNMNLLSYEHSKKFGDVLRSQNCSLATLVIDHVDDDDCLAVIFDGLSLNKSVETFCSWPTSVGSSTRRFEKKFKTCLETNRSLMRIDFSEDIPLLPDCSAVVNRYRSNVNAMWSSSIVCGFCTAIKSNNTLITLDITGCYIDKTASDAVCAMLSLNASLRGLFLNPIHMEETEAVAIVTNCNNNNTTLELLSLYQCPAVGENMWTEKTFEYAHTIQMGNMLYQLQESRQSKNLTVIWLVVCVLCLLCYTFCFL